jgi:hypothetical protein
MTLRTFLICSQFLIPSVSTFSKTTMHCILKVFLFESKLWNNGQKIKKVYLKYTCEIYLGRKKYEIIVKIATCDGVRLNKGGPHCTHCHFVSGRQWCPSSMLWCIFAGFIYICVRGDVDC